MKKTILILLGAGWILSCSACIPQETPTPPPARESKIPQDAEKILPEEDAHPPVLHGDDYKQPKPLPGPINTAGGEDSPFISRDGKRLIFFFTPDVSLPHQEQLLDGVTGLYLSRAENGRWSEPQRVALNNDVALDGCPFLSDDTLWFCSARAGVTGVHWFTAQYSDGSWTDWEEVNFDPSHKVGELHITADGEELFFHSDRPGSKGMNDIWVSHKTMDGWGEPENLGTVNTPENETRPYLTADDQELWYTRNYQGSPAIYRSQRREGEWTEPELIISQFAGEPTMDPQGNIYFVHHFFREGEMIEADIYVADKK